MGRPIKKIFIGERGAGNAGGEGVASVTVVAGDSAGYADFEPLIIGAPDIEGGTQAAGYILTAAGAVDSVVITEEGNGYTSPPTVTIDTVGGTETTLVLTAVLTTTNAGVINCTAFVPVADGGSSAVLGDIIAQKATRIYRVTTAQGTGECELVASVPVAGEMTIIATDSSGSTYYVTKLMNRTVIVTQLVVSGAFEFADGAKVGWADVAVLDYSVKITS